MICSDEITEYQTRGTNILSNFSLWDIKRRQKKKVSQETGKGKEVANGSKVERKESQISNKDIEVPEPGRREWPA